MTEVRRGAPTPPIPFARERPTKGRLRTASVDIDSDVERSLRDATTVVDSPDDLAEASRDWWPLAMIWALDDEVPALASLAVRPSAPDEVADVLRICNEARVPVTTAAGRSGVCGASVPVHGGIVLDLCAMSGVVDVDEVSQIVDVRPGTFGDVYEDTLRSTYGLTGGHWPQSIALSTVGGWLACRGAGQYSTRYGKIEDLVVGLDVVLADGTAITTGGPPRAAVGPDLTQLFVGSEGTLGVITGARLRVHPAPTHTRTAAFGFPSFDTALDVMRRCVQRGATPAALRLYDAQEADRSYATGDANLLLVLDEGDEAIVDGTLSVVEQECGSGDLLDAGLVDQWLEHRNDTSALQALISKGYVVDTMEVSAPWSRLPAIYEQTCEAIRAVEHTLVCSAHQSHSYRDGGCLYFTFAAQPPATERERYYLAAWDAGTRAVVDAGGALSHHHGIGLNRARFVRDALGPAFDALVTIKAGLDPNGILNPSKLGLPSAFGSIDWP